MKKSFNLALHGGRRNSRSTPRTSDRRERGAALVESSIVMPLLLLLIFGTIDGTMIFSGYLTAGRSANNAARAAAESANDELADYNAIRAALSSGKVLDNNAVQKIVVFKATSADSDAPQACLDGSSSVAAMCNVYTADAFSKSADAFVGSDSGWPAKNREISRDATPPLIGVAIQYKASALLGTFGAPNPLITRTSVMQLEARAA